MRYSRKVKPQNDILDIYCQYNIIQLKASLDHKEFRIPTEMNTILDLNLKCKLALLEGQPVNKTVKGKPIYSCYSHR